MRERASLRSDRMLETNDKHGSITDGIFGIVYTVLILFFSNFVSKCLVCMEKPYDLIQCVVYNAVIIN